MKQLVEKKVAEKRSQQGQLPATVAPPTVPSTSQQHDKNTTQVQLTTATPTNKPPINTHSITPLPSLPATPLVSNMTLPGLTPQQQQLLRLHLSKFPEEQQKLCLEQVKKELEKQQSKAQQLTLQQQKQLSGSKQQLVTVNSAPSNLTQQQQQHLSVLLKQQELIRQQQANLGLNSSPVSQVSQISQMSPKKGGSLSQVRKPLMSLLARRMDKEEGQGQSPGKSKSQEK